MTASSFVITIISHEEGLSLDEKKNFTAFIGKIHGASIDQERALSNRAHDYYLTSTDSLETLKKHVDQYPANNVDVVTQVNNEYRKNKGLVVFDMDSTLIYQEVIELIAAYAQVEKQVAEITNRAMNNELDFKQSLAERVSLLKGIKTATLYDEIKAKLRVTEGVPELTKGLKKTGCKLAVLSGGFTPFANFMKDRLELDYARANVLATETDAASGETILSGFTLGDMVDGECKARTLLELTNDYAVPLESTVMVGDGGNDLPAMAVAGFGIAWNAKPKVQAAAPCKLNTRSLRDAFYIFGYSEDEIRELLE